MASFCKTCSEEMFDKDFKEFANLITQEKFDEGYAPIVLCETCGAIQVDPNGVCISTDCEHCKVTMQHTS